MEIPSDDYKSEPLYLTCTTLPNTDAPILVVSFNGASWVHHHMKTELLYFGCLADVANYAEKDEGYALVVLTADESPVGYKRVESPLWWIRKWKTLPRNHRKKLKKLYIVHPSNTTRVISTFLLPLISPKAFMKIHNVVSLQSLYRDHGISPRGIKVDVATLRQEAIATTTSAKTASFPWSIFANSGPAETRPLLSRSRHVLDIEDLYPPDSSEPPAGLQSLRNAILRESCRGTEGIFRRSSNSTMMAPLIAFSELPLDLQPTILWGSIAVEDPLLPPKYLAQLLHNLTEPIIAPSLYPLIRTSNTLHDIRDKVLPLLGQSQRLMLLFMTNLIRDAAKHVSTTKMSVVGLSTVIAPALISGPDPLEDAAMCLPPGKKLPAAMTAGKTEHKGDGTVIGLLELLAKG